jgi:glycopeptide antibiotics resistance protein
MILTPLPGHREVNLVPLVDLVDQLAGSAAVAFFQVVGNLLVFAAFGALAPVRWRLAPWAVVAVAATASVTVEILQYGLDLGRVSSIDDVLLNAAGAGLAALASRRMWAAALPEPRVP